MQQSYPLARAGRRRLSGRFWTFGVSWRHWRLEFDLRSSSMRVVKYETDGLRLAGEVHLWRLLDRGLWRRSSDALSENVWPHRICDATMALFDGRSLKRPPDNGVSSNGLSGSLSMRERRNWWRCRPNRWLGYVIDESADNVWLAARFSIVLC